MIVGGRDRSTGHRQLLGISDRAGQPAEEIARARQLHQRAGVVVRDIMRDARLGNAVHVEDVAALVDDITQSVVRNSGALLSMLQIGRAHV